MNEGREAEFEKAFGPDGLWSEFLRSVEGYLRTELQREQSPERQYKGFDVWRSHLDFEAFRGREAAGCERFSRWVAGEGLLEREMWLGSFYDEPGEDEAGLVTA